MTRPPLHPGEPVLVSACLLGIHCRYDGRTEVDERVLALAGRHVLVPVCPEQLGGLPTPRDAVEISGGRAVTRSGADLSEAFRLGADQVLRIAALTGARVAILQPRSPSCGAGEIYDGTFSGRRIPGDGILAAGLRGMGLLSSCDPMRCKPWTESPLFIEPFSPYLYSTGIVDGRTG